MKIRHLLQVAAAAIVALCSCSHEKAVLTVTPYPNDVTINCGTFNAAGADFAIDPALDADAKGLVSCFASRLSAISGKESKVSEGTAATGFTFVLDTALAPEAYSLEVNKKQVSVRASSTKGVRFAIQTLKQMLPVEIFGETPAPGAEWKLQCCAVNDAPRFGYRGLHLDVSRHFFSLDEVKKYLDIMEVYKMNTLHWHLTDDQGWRVEIKKYPRLTEVGSWRKGTMIRKEWTNYDG
ncbi:MAG: family 20 glycosylhydrolase, partial [Candidatus Cryptobacteroides sp.]